MAQFRSRLPQLDGEIVLCDAGVETDLIFNHGVEIPHFAAHTLLTSAVGRAALTNYFNGFLDLAAHHDVGFVLDTQTWKAHPHWAADLGATDGELRDANRDAVEFVASLRAARPTQRKPIVLNGLIGPRGDAYAPDETIAAADAERYHHRQLEWLAETELDMVTAMTFTQASEAVGVVRAAVDVGLPIVVSFTVETDGRLPTGQPLADAITEVDAATNSAAAYFMVNCAHPDHFAHVIDDAPWSRRIRGFRCNASRRSHAELDASETLDAGDPHELAQQYVALRGSMPWTTVFGGCCGSDLRHVREIARAVLG